MKSYPYYYREAAGEELEQSFREYSAIDVNQRDIFFDISYYISDDINSSYALESYEALQVMNAKVIVGEVDFMIGDLSIMNDMVYQQYFLELSSVVKEDVLEKIKPYLIYYDKCFLEELSNIDVSEEGEVTIDYPDSRNPGLMQEPVPVFVDISSCAELRKLYPCDESECVIALTINGSNTERVLEFIEFLMK